MVIYFRQLKLFIVNLKVSHSLSSWSQNFSYGIKYKERNLLGLKPMHVRSKLTKFPEVGSIRELHSLFTVFSKVSQFQVGRTGEHCVMDIHINAGEVIGIEM
jgi:hypothetical protein